MYDRITVSTIVKIGLKYLKKGKHKCQTELQTNKQITKVFVENDPCYISIPWGTHHWKV